MDKNIEQHKQIERTRKVSGEVTFGLDAIIAIGYRVTSKESTDLWE